VDKIEDQLSSIPIDEKSLLGQDIEEQDDFSEVK